MNERHPTLTVEEGDRSFRRTAGRIGLCMLLHMLILNILTGAVMVMSLILDSLGGSQGTARYVLEEILNMVAYALGFLIPALVLWRLLRKERAYEMGQRGLPGTTVLLVFAAIALNFAAAYMNTGLVTLLLPGQTPDPSVFEAEAEGPLQLVLSLISIAVIPAVVEELLFRRVILEGLLPYGRGVAILGSAFLFGLMHGNILQILYTVLMGIILGVLYTKTRSILLCMLIHFTNNAISVMQDAILSDPSPELGLRLNGFLELTVLVLGGISLAVLLIRHWRTPKAEDGGSFGRLYEPDPDFSYVPITRRARMRLFFAPSMVVYTVLSVLTMAGTMLLLMAMEA